MVGYERETLERLPLAESAYRLLDYVTAEDFLNEVYDNHRGRSYTKLIDFPLLVHLVADALLEHQGSGHKSFRKASEQGVLTTSLKAAYGKLSRVPLGLSQGLLARGSQRLQDVCPAVPSVVLPNSVKDMTVLIMDGKKIKHVAHRLKVLRQVRGHVLAAKIAVALNMSTGLVVAMSAHHDGEAGDAPLVPELLAQTRARTSGPRLWVEDALYCDLNQPRLVREGGDHYLIRYNPKVSFHQDLARPARAGVDERGRPYQEEWGWLGKENDARRQYVRRITLERPDEESVILVTDLVGGECYPALDLLFVYLHRWGIERVFQRITEVFHLRSLIGSTPQAGVFQAAFCLLLYNVIMVLRAYISRAQERAPETISTENLFYDVHRDLVALHEVLSVPEIVKLFDERLPTRQLRRRLGTLLTSQWSMCWLKAPAKNRKPPAAKQTYYLRGGHTSVYRLLQKAKNHQAKAPQAEPK
jgi:Transposase DDE domain